MGFNHENLRNHGDYMGIIVGECLYPAVFFTVCPHKSPFLNPIDISIYWYFGF